MKCRAQLLLSQNTQHAALSEISREEAMHIPKDAMLLRIFFGENDRFEQQSLSEAIVLKAREMHLAGVDARHRRAGGQVVQLAQR